MITLASKTKFETEIKSLKEAFTAKEAEHVALTAELERVKTELTELRNKPPVIVEKDNKEEVDALKKELADAKAAIESFNVKVTETAIDIVASQGIAPVSVPVEPKKQVESSPLGFGSRVVFTK